MFAAAKSAVSTRLVALRRTAVRTAIGTTVVFATFELSTNLPTQGRASQFYHDLCDQVVLPSLRRFLHAETAHNVAIRSAQWGFAPIFRPSAAEQRVDASSRFFVDKQLDNPIGLAAGFDKDGQAIQAMLDLGFGLVEIGTVTPQPQPGNAKPRMFRLVEDEGVINRYGFNSAGSAQVLDNLRQFRQAQREYQQRQLQLKQAQQRATLQEHAFSILQFAWTFAFPPYVPRNGLVGVNLGKNKTSEDALADYESGIRQFLPHADYLVINISSPNTQGLRNLQHGDSLRALLQHCLRVRNEECERIQQASFVPLLVKLAPDLTDSELQEIANTCLQVGIDGLVVTNTTNQRPDHLQSPNKHEVGGLSGAPLRDASTDCIRKLYALTQGSIPIIGVGGVANGKHAYDKLAAGASVVQVYSMMVYEGPGMVSRIRRELAQLLVEHGQRSVQDDVVGSWHEELFWKKKQAQLEAKQDKIPADERVFLDET